MTPSQSDAAFKAARRIINESGYGSYISDDQVRKFSEAIARAVLNHKD